MSHTPKFDEKIKVILDALEPGERICPISGEKWMLTQKEIDLYKRFNVSPSKYSPLTRMKLINGYFAIFDVWYNKHAETGKPMISTTHPSTGIKVLSDEEWFTKDCIDRGLEIKSDISIFDQIHELMLSVPLAASYNYVPAENSIAFISLGDQNSYFVLACKSKHCFYSMNAYDAEDSAEVALANNVRNCYNIVHSARLYDCKFARESYDCIDCSFVFDCRNSEHCFGAVNQRNKKYIFFNEQLTKQEWEEKVQAIDLSSYKVRQEYERRFKELMKEAVWPENFNVHSDDSTGEYIDNSTNVQNSFNVVKGSRNLDYTSYVVSTPCNDCYYVSGLFGSSDSYYGIGVGQSSGAKFTLSVCMNCIDVEYCSSCYDCENCFGCVGLRRKKFCILNTQYTEEEYWKKLDEIKSTMLDRGEYGDMPSMKFSTQYWNGSGATVLFGATKEECLKLGAIDVEPGADGAEGAAIDPKVIRSIEAIPDKIDADNKKDQIGVPFMDEVFGRRFAYLAPELDLYEKLKIASPRKHPTARMHDLYQEMNSALREVVQCAACEKEIEIAQNTHYPDRKIYCKPCYLRFIEENN